MPHKHLHINIHSSIIPNSQKIEATKCLKTNEDYMYLYSTILFGNLKKNRILQHATWTNLEHAMEDAKHKRPWM